VAGAVPSRIVDDDDVNRWFGGYLDAFAACGRGESDTASLLAHYGVPLIVTTDEASFALADGDQVVGMLRRQVDEVRAAGYDRTEILDSTVTVLNATSALYRGTLSRQRRDGTEIGRITVTYLVADGPAGRRIAAFAVHST
jgi:hypothetical protein